MKKILLSTILLVLFTPLLSTAQMWEQLPTEPDGGGVTDICYDENLEIIFVATGSYNWPNGEDGGIRRSINDGLSWDNLFDAYTSRVVMIGPDNNLYASVWDYPSDEGLYRSSNQGSTWDLLVSVPSGNNIFSIAVKEGSPNIIFAGTRQGVYRSLDNGTSWAYTNDIIPSDAWVRGLAVGPDGTIAAATSYGCYTSSDDGDTWDKVTGDGENEYAISVEFDQEPAQGDEMPTTYLMIGTTEGNLYITDVFTAFTVSTFVVAMAAQKELTRIRALRIAATLLPIYMFSFYAATGGNFFYSLALLSGWTPMLAGLPANALISIFTSYIVTGSAIAVAYLALYGNLINLGTTIFKIIFNIPLAVGEQPIANNLPSLYQNIPNPFKDQTRINFELPESGPAQLILYDMAGNQVSVLADEVMNRGKHSILVEKQGLAPGMYYYRLSANNTVQAKKLIIQ